MKKKSIRMNKNWFRSYNLKSYFLSIYSHQEILKIIIIKRVFKIMMIGSNYVVLFSNFKNY